MATFTNWNFLINSPSWILLEGSIITITLASSRPNFHHIFRSFLWKKRTLISYRNIKYKQRHQQQQLQQRKNPQITFSSILRSLSLKNEELPQVEFLTSSTIKTTAFSPLDIINFPFHLCWLLRWIVWIKRKKNSLHKNPQTSREIIFHFPLSFLLSFSNDSSALHPVDNIRCS